MYLKIWYQWFKVENADVTLGSVKVTPPTLPEDYDAEYAAEGLTNVSVENGILKYNATGVKQDSIH